MHRIVTALMTGLLCSTAHAAFLQFTATGIVSGYTDRTNFLGFGTGPDNGGANSALGKEATISLLLNLDNVPVDIGGEFGQPGRAFYAGGCAATGHNWITTGELTIAGRSVQSVIGGPGNAAECDVVDILERDLSGRFDSMSAQDLEWSYDTFAATDGRTLFRDAREQATIGVNDLDLVDMISGLSVNQSFDLFGNFGNADFMKLLMTGSCLAEECESSTLIDMQYSIQATHVTLKRIPEPGSLALFATGAFGLMLLRRRRAKK